MTARFLAVYVIALGCPVLADIDVGSDGSDGVFDPQSNITVDLSLAASLCDCDGGGMLDDECRWDCPSPVEGQGVYDAEQWAVVFKYSSITIPAGVTVKFSNHASRAPVVWLSQEDVVIGGTINLDGAPGHPDTGPAGHSEPGPGGFRGGRGTRAGVSSSAGLGPGGSGYVGGGRGGGASYATTGGGPLPGQTYGNLAVLPLIGGSGAAGGGFFGGGAGAGAILVGANTSITLSAGGKLLARGADGQGLCCCGGTGACGGSGGALRLVSEVIIVHGALRAHHGAPANQCWISGDGRIRVEGNDVVWTDPGEPLLVEDLPTFIFPPALSPTIRATILEDSKQNQHAVPEDPNGVIDDPVDVDVNIATKNPVTVHIEASDLPVDAVVDVRVVAASGPTNAYPATNAGGTCEASTWTATGVAVPVGYSVFQVRAFFEDFDGCGGQPLGRAGVKGIGQLKTLNGERIVGVEVNGGFDGRSRLIYRTETGRQIPVDPR